MKYGYSKGSTLHQDLKVQLQTLKKRGATKFILTSSPGLKRTGRCSPRCYKNGKQGYIGSNKASLFCHKYR